MNGRAGVQGGGYALLGALLLMTVIIAGRAARDALFLANYPVTFLPRMMIAAGIASLIGATAMSRLLARYGPATVVPIALTLSAGLFAAEWSSMETAAGPATLVLYVHVAVLGTIAFSGFWSVVNERFDPFTAKAIVRRAGGLSALGSAVGGLGALWVAPRLGVPALLPILGALHAAAGVCVWRLGRGATARPTPPEAGALTGLASLRRQPLVRRMALLVVLVTVTEELLDYAFKVSAFAAYSDETSLLRFFALFHAATGILAFAVQSTLGARVLALLGLSGAMAMLPAAVAVASGGAALVTRLASVSIARATNAVVALSLFRSGFELLWTPLPVATKRSAKTYVDVGARSVGELTGGGLVLVALAVLSELPVPVVLGFAALLCAASLLLIAQLHTRYVGQLAENLQAGVVELETEEVEDATTARTLADSRVTIDRAEILARLRELEAGGGEEAGAREPLEEASRWREEALALESGEASRMREALAHRPVDRRLIAHVIPLLGRADLWDETVSFLTEVAPRATGQLADAMLDPSSEVLVRRRLPRMVERGEARRAMLLLVAGLDDPDFEVRLECARAGARLAGREPAVRIARPLALQLLTRELAVDGRTWEQHGRRRPGADATALLQGADTRLDRSTELVFSLLAMLEGPDVVISAIRSLYSRDPMLQGTALEYLHALLPEAQRAQLWPRIPGAPETRSGRGADELARELLAHAGRRAGR